MGLSGGRGAAGAMHNSLENTAFEPNCNESEPRSMGTIAV
jgi:hypothetical protein